MNSVSLNNGCHFLPGFFQIAYATNDLDRAMRAFDEQFGVKRFFKMPDMPYDAETRMSIATAYIGEVMIEIIEPHGPGHTIYDDALPPGDEFAIRHHHMGHLFEKEEDLQRVVDLAAARRQPIAYEGGVEGVIKAVYVDTRESLGHYLEYIYCTPAGLEFLNQAPRN